MGGGRRWGKLQNKVLVVRTLSVTSLCVSCSIKYTHGMFTVTRPGAQGLWDMDNTQGPLMVAGFMPITEVFTDLRPGGGFGPCVSFLGLLSQMTTYWVVYNNISFSQCWRPEVQSQNVSRAALLQGSRVGPFLPLPASGGSNHPWCPCDLCLCSHMAFSLCVSSKNISHWIQGPP